MVKSVDSTARRHHDYSIGCQTYLGVRGRISVTLGLFSLFSDTSIHKKQNDDRNITKASRKHRHSRKSFCLTLATAYTHIGKRPRVTNQNPRALLQVSVGIYNVIISKISFSSTIPFGVNIPFQRHAIKNNLTCCSYWVYMLLAWLHC